MTSLRQRMTEDMQVRNLALNTQTSYVQQVSLFARHFDKSPEQLGPEDIRAYQVYLTNEKKLAPGSVLIAVAALRFLYKVSLKKNWTLRGRHPGAEEAAETAGSPEPGGGPPLSELRGQHQTSRDSDDLLRRRPAHLRGHPPEAHRHRQPAHGHSRGARQGTERPVRHALAQAAGNPAQLVAGGEAQAMALPGRYSWRPHPTGRPWNWRARRRGDVAAFAKPITPHSCATPSRSICWNPAPTCAPFNCCSAIAAWRPRPAICGSPPPRCAPPPVRSTCCRGHSPLSRKPAAPQHF